MVSILTISKKVFENYSCNTATVKDLREVSYSVSGFYYFWHGFGPIDIRNPVQGTFNRILNIRNINIHNYEHNKLSISHPSE
jgi:hypothetical protein